MALRDLFFRKKMPTPAGEQEVDASADGGASDTLMSDWRDSKAQLELLARFYRGADPWKFVGKEHWSDVLGAKPEQMIERLRVMGALVPAPAGIALAHRCTLEDLQFQLAERSLSTDGSKEELIRRLIAKDPDAVRQMTSDVNVLMLSDDARRQVTRYVRAERARRETAERKALVGLLQGDFLRAALAAAEFQDDSVFPRGVGVAFGDEDQRENVAILEALFARTPELLSSVDAVSLDALRPAAGMAFLWGRESAQPWIPKDMSLDVAWSADVICSMLLTHARFLNDRERFRQSHYGKFEIAPRNDEETCIACRSLHGELWSLESLPELPHAACTATRGCRCRIVVSEHAF
ncbi:MAG: SAP domain-containing protein [Bacteroidota bacterium]|nr:SAP domain-containing protein [Bacteroidota bacterium]